MAQSKKSPKIPAGYQPITMWGYFGYQILFGLPIIGLIFLIIFAFFNKDNLNRTNFARSYFCVLVVVLILSCLVMSMGIGVGLLEYLQSI